MVGEMRQQVVEVGRSKADVGEAFFMTRALRFDLTSDKWPRNLAGFQETLVEYFDALDDLCQRMLRVIAVGLEMPADFFVPR